MLNLQKNEQPQLLICTCYPIHILFIQVPNTASHIKHCTGIAVRIKLPWLRGDNIALLRFIHHLADDSYYSAEASVSAGNPLLFSARRSTPNSNAGIHLCARIIRATPIYDSVCEVDAERLRSLFWDGRDTLSGLKKHAHVHWSAFLSVVSWRPYHSEAVLQTNTQSCFSLSVRDAPEHHVKHCKTFGLAGFAFVGCQNPAAHSPTHIPIVLY